MLPDIGTIPKQMLAAVISQDRYGQPSDAFGIEEVPVPSIGSRQVLVAVMAAGVSVKFIGFSATPPGPGSAEPTRR